MRPTPRAPLRTPTPWYNPSYHPSASWVGTDLRAVRTADAALSEKSPYPQSSPENTNPVVQPRLSPEYLPGRDRSPSGPHRRHWRFRRNCPNPGSLPLGEPGVCPTIALFSSTTNHFPIGGFFSTASFRLRGSAFALCAKVEVVRFQSGLRTYSVPLEFRVRGWRRGSTPLQA